MDAAARSSADYAEGVSGRGSVTLLDDGEEAR
jgi:hypothetical protein